MPRVAGYNVTGFALFAADGAYLIDGDYQTAEDAGAGCRETTAPAAGYLPCQLIRSSALRFHPARQRGGVLAGP